MRLFYKKEQKMGQFCRDGYPVCKSVRKKQKGVLFWFIKTFESVVCPYCEAYEKVYGLKAQEPVLKQKHLFFHFPTI
jgi:hypothetical protein